MGFPPGGTQGRAELQGAKSSTVRERQPWGRALSSSLYRASGALEGRWVLEGAEG